jgi:hypothetical protein
MENAAEYKAWFPPPCLRDHESGSRIVAKSSHKRDLYVEGPKAIGKKGSGKDDA